ncbi:terminase small subunit [Lachnoclostridium sp. An138]|uniref:terminase small subunit n=1 Tax=Lachnoclostridium sp. An138 TaxID=1965560 RepID=UPI000B36FADE|nr:terminase small subunit [Lachnoclostridium sp. An138]OUQ17742.1 terminase small subunit [Lachnoclostridium sp. An138]
MTKKQKRFIEEYLIDLNATQAAIRAGYSPKTAKDIGCENLAKPNISDAIDKAMAERSRRTGINQDRILLELARIGLAKITDVVDPDTGKLLPNASEDDLACIQSIKIKPNEFGTEREVKLYDKKSALVDLGKHLGMFKDKVELSGSLETEKTKLDDLIQQMRGGGG